MDRNSHIAVGGKLRHWRRIKGMTLLELADRVGCSESLLSKIENDKIKPSLRVLHAMVAALEANVAMLFREDDGEADVVSRPGDRLHLKAIGDGITLENLIPSTGTQLLQSTIHVVEPGGATDGTIEHSGEEMGYVLDGAVELLLGDRVIPLTAGDAFHFRSEIPHGYRNVGGAVAKILWVNTPPTF